LPERGTMVYRGIAPLAATGGLEGHPLAYPLEVYMRACGWNLWTLALSMGQGALEIFRVNLEEAPIRHGAGLPEMMET